jgi:hypothetical protein
LTSSGPCHSNQSRRLQSSPGSSTKTGGRPSLNKNRGASIPRRGNPRLLLQEGFGRNREETDDEGAFGYPEDPSSPDYPTQGPSCSNPGGHGWPECWGTCFAGQCKLDKLLAGCCHLSLGQHGSYRDHGYASTVAVGANGADGVVAAGSAMDVPVYTREGKQEVVCWDWEDV